MSRDVLLVFFFLLFYEMPRPRNISYSTILSVGACHRDRIVSEFLKPSRLELAIHVWPENTRIFCGTPSLLGLLVILSLLRGQTDRSYFGQGTWPPDLPTLLVSLLAPTGTWPRILERVDTPLDTVEEDMPACEVGVHAPASDKFHLASLGIVLGVDVERADLLE